MAELGKAIGTDSGNISNWENDKRVPGGNFIANLAKFFNVSADWILFGTDFKQQCQNTVSKPIFHSMLNYTDIRGVLTPEEEWGLLEEAKNELELLKYVEDENNRKALTRLIKRLNSDDLAFLADLTNRLFKSYSMQELVRAQDQEEEVNHHHGSDPDRQRESFKETQEIYYMPVISQIAAGQPLGPEDFIEGYLPLPVNLVKNKTFLTRVRGDSMIGDGIRDGDIVQIRLQPVVEHGEIAAVRINGEVTLKYFLRKNNTIVLRSSNPDYQDIIVKSGDDVDIIGKYINNFPKEETEPLIDRFRSI